MAEACEQHAEQDYQQMHAGARERGKRETEGVETNKHLV